MRRRGQRKKMGRIQMTSSGVMRLSGTSAKMAQSSTPWTKGTPSARKYHGLAAEGIRKNAVVAKLHHNTCGKWVANVYRNALPGPILQVHGDAPRGGPCPAPFPLVPTERGFREARRRSEGDRRRHAGATRIRPLLLVKKKHVPFKSNLSHKGSRSASGACVIFLGFIRGYR